MEPGVLKTGQALETLVFGGALDSWLIALGESV